MGRLSCWFGFPHSNRQESAPMTIDRVAMKELLEKGSDQDLLREMLAFVASRMMDVEVESLTGAAHGERSPERMAHRRRHGAGRDPEASQGQLLSAT